VIRINPTTIVEARSTLSLNALFTLSKKPSCVREESLAPFELLDLGPHARDLALDLHRFGDAPRLLHDRHVLIFEVPLHTNAGVEVDVLFGDVLPRDLLVKDATVAPTDLLHRRLETRGGNADGHGDGVRPLDLLGFGRDDEPTVDLRDVADAALTGGRILQLDRDVGVADDLAIERLGDGLVVVRFGERDGLQVGSAALRAVSGGRGDHPLLRYRRFSDALCFVTRGPGRDRRAIGRSSRRDRGFVRLHRNLRSHVPRRR
jgi:hypothetical protein